MKSLMFPFLADTKLHEHCFYISLKIKYICTLLENINFSVIIFDLREDYAQRVIYFDLRAV